MRDAPFAAKVYILCTLVVGGCIIGWSLQYLPPDRTLAAAIAAVLAAIAQVPKVEGPTRKSSYNVALVVYGFSFAALGLPAAIFVMLFACVAEWAWHRYPWFIQTFNIATLAVALGLAKSAQTALTNLAGTASHVTIAGLVLSVAVFVAVNHLMVGTVIFLARGEDFHQSGVFGRLTLTIDGTLFAMGLASALLWRVNEFAPLLSVVPLYLIYTALRIPSLERQACTDPKTGLYNARYFAEVLQRELDRADRYERPLSVVIGDLDLLRYINNTYGHLAGDEVLAGVARIIRDAVREYDVVARIGGEEFAILMNETSLEQAAAHVESIRVAIENADFEVPTSVTPIAATMSFGIAERQALGAIANDLLHNADIALYQAKLEGRNRVCVSAQPSPGSMPAAPPQPANDHVSSHPLASELPSPAFAAAEEREKPPRRGATLRLAYEADGGPEPATASVVRPRPAWHTTGPVVLLTLTASAAMWFTWDAPPATGLAALSMLGIVAMLTEALAIDIYAGETSVSTLPAPFIAAVLLFGHAGIVIVGVGAATVAMLKHRSPPSRFFFNSSTHALAGLACLGLVRLVDGGPVSDWPVWLLVAVTVCASMLMYAVTTWLIAMMVHLRTDVRIVPLWRERFGWLAPYYLALGLAAVAFVLAYLRGGVAGIVVITVPLFMLRIGQEQYVRRTSKMVGQLRKTNTALERQTQEISALNEDLLYVLSDVVHLRDPFVSGHAQHVARYAVDIATELGLGADRVEAIRRAGLLHDVGKLGVPEQILFKPGHLDHTEYERVKEHTALGAEIVSNARALKRLVPFIRHHHERWDGLGYPDGLRGEEIPIEARILALADAVEAMASDRPYREGMMVHDILNEVRANAGVRFDPKVVAAFSRVIAREGETMIVNSADHVAGTRVRRDRRAAEGC